MVAPDKPARFVTLNGSGTPATQPAEPNVGPNTDVIASLDRMNVLAQECCATANLPLGKSIIIGGMTLEPEGSAPADANSMPKPPARQLYLALRVDAKWRPTPICWNTKTPPPE